MCQLGGVLPFLPKQFLHPTGEPVQGGTDVSDLVDRRVRGASGEVAGGHGVRRLLQIPQRGHCAPGQPPRGTACQPQQHQRDPGQSRQSGHQPLAQFLGGEADEDHGDLLVEIGRRGDVPPAVHDVGGGTTAGGRLDRPGGPLRIRSLDATVGVVEADLSRAASLGRVERWRLVVLRGLALPVVGHATSFGRGLTDLIGLHDVTGGQPQWNQQRDQC